MKIELEATLLLSIYRFRQRYLEDSLLTARPISRACQGLHPRDSRTRTNVRISGAKISFKDLDAGCISRAFVCCSVICQQQNKSGLILHDEILLEKTVITPGSSLPYILVGLFVTRTKRRSVLRHI